MPASSSPCLANMVEIFFISNSLQTLNLILLFDSHPLLLYLLFLPFVICPFFSSISTSPTAHASFTPRSMSRSVLVISWPTNFRRLITYSFFCSRSFFPFANARNIFLFIMTAMSMLTQNIPHATSGCPPSPPRFTCILPSTTL
jgi:hypothetical protein